MRAEAEASGDVHPDCLDEVQLQALVDGQLPDGELARVEAHVHHCAHCAGLVADAACGADSQERRSKESSSHAPSAGHDGRFGANLRAGDQIDGKYEIEKALKRGGMGAVFSARHVELGHRVAIKVLCIEGMGAAARFLREAKTCAGFVGQHIVRVSDFGRLPSGVPYLVMEHLVGRDLSQVIAEGPVPLSEALRYVREACAGLREAHAAGVIHRDLKPSNLFLVERPLQRSTIKILDFGISKSVHPGSLDTTLTSAGAIMGSPLYMSPEQIRSDLTIDVRTDIWSLGVILYELLTGDLPFEGPSLSALAIAIATEPCPDPSCMNPALESALGQVVLRCLHKEPSRRFADVDALADALEPFGVLHGTHDGSRRARTTRPHQMALPPLEVSAHTTSTKSGTSRTRRALLLASALVSLIAVAITSWLRSDEDGRARVVAPDTATQTAVPTRPAPSVAVAVQDPPSPIAPSSAAPPSDAAVGAEPASRLPRDSPQQGKPRARRRPSSVPPVPAMPKIPGPLDTPD